jgi:hypothetical protein
VHRIADLFVFFEDEDREAFSGESGSGGQAGRAGADYDDIVTAI